MWPLKERLVSFGRVGPRKRKIGLSRKSYEYNCWLSCISQIVDIVVNYSDRYDEIVRLSYVIPALCNMSV